MSKTPEERCRDYYAAHPEKEAEVQAVIATAAAPTTRLTPLPSGLWSLTLIASDGTEQVIEARDGGGLTLEECEQILDELEQRQERSDAMDN